MRARIQRQAITVLCLIAGIMHLLGGRFLVMLLGVGYLVAAVGMLRRWKRARAVAGTVAGIRVAGTILLILFKLPGLIGGTAGPEDGDMLDRDLIWLVVNAGILVLLATTGVAKPTGKAGCV